MCKTSSGYQPVSFIPRQVAAPPNFCDRLDRGIPDHEREGPAAAVLARELDERDVTAVGEDDDAVADDGRSARRAVGPGEALPESAVIHRRPVYRLAAHRAAP